MEHLLVAASSIQRFTSFIGRLAAWLLVPLMLVIVADVTLRHWFVIGSTKLQELEWHLHGALFLMCLAWAFNSGAHVRIELFSEKWSARSKAWVELFGCLAFLLPYSIVVIWFGWDYVEYSIAYGESSSSPTGLTNRWIIKSAIPFGFFMLALSALSRLLTAFVFLFGSDQLKTRITLFNATTENEQSIKLKANSNA